MTLAGKINADVCQLNKHLSFREVFRSTPRSSLFFAGYAGLLSCFGLSQMLVQNRLIAEEKPCDSCILTRNIIIALSSGIIVPCVSLPYLAHYNVRGQYSPKDTTFGIRLADKGQSKNATSH